jgi:hypothetical protein
VAKLETSFKWEVYALFAVAIGPPFFLVRALHGAHGGGVWGLWFVRVGLSLSIPPPDPPSD